jgi:hypothetical protein
MPRPHSLPMATQRRNSLIGRVLATLTALMLTFVISTSAPGVAHAGSLAAPTPTATPVRGSSIQTTGGIPGKGVADPVFLREKQAMATRYATVRGGQLPLAQFVAEQRTFEAKWYGPSPAAPRVSSATAGKVLAGVAFACCQSHDLAVNHAAQQSNTYCGPGATYAVLAYLGYSTSHDGETLTQSCIGGACGSGNPYSLKYLETNYWDTYGGGNGGTPWWVSGSDYPVPGTLNYWRTGTYTGFYAGVFPSSESTYELDLTYDIDNYWPFMIDVHEPASGTHLVGHPPAVEIFHWITGFGYSNYGAGTDYIDPAANSTLGWSGVSAYNYNFASSTMYYLMSNNGYQFGIVW